MFQPTVRTRPPEVRRDERGHAFYPDAARLAEIPPLYGTENTPCEHKTIYAHYFAAWGDWYIAEYDPATGEAFGWCVLGADTTQGEWGYIDLPALESFRAERGLPRLVERDIHFTLAIAAECLPEGRHIVRCDTPDCTVCNPTEP